MLEMPGKSLSVLMRTMVGVLTLLTGLTPMATPHGLVAKRRAVAHIMIILLIIIIILLVLIFLTI